MNWEAVGAVGEIAGAFAVLVTLIYLSIQVRSMRAAASADSFARNDEGERELRALFIAHATLMLRANGGEDLDQEESYILDNIYRSYRTYCFHAYGRANALGYDGLVHARRFASIINENPSFRVIYEGGRLATDGAGGLVGEFNAQVQQYLEST